LFRPITKEEGMAKNKCKVVKGPIRYISKGEKVIKQEGEECDMDNQVVYEHFKRLGYVEDLTPSKKKKKKKEEVPEDASEV